MSYIPHCKNGDACVDFHMSRCTLYHPELCSDGISCCEAGAACTSSHAHLQIARYALSPPGGMRAAIASGTHPMCDPLHPSRRRPDCKNGDACTEFHKGICPFWHMPLCPDGSECDGAGTTCIYSHAHCQISCESKSARYEAIRLHEARQRADEEADMRATDETLWRSSLSRARLILSHPEVNHHVIHRHIAKSLLLCNPAEHEKRERRAEEAGMSVDADARLCAFRLLSREKDRIIILHHVAKALWHSYREAAETPIAVVARGGAGYARV